MADHKDLGVDVSRARFWSNAQLTIEIPMPDKDVVEQALGYVPIVRCEACKFSEPQYGKARRSCGVLGLLLHDDFFCAYGERREPEG